MNKDKETPLNVEQLAAALDLKPSWVYVHASELGGVKLGKYWRFFPTKVEAIKRNGLELESKRDLEA
jgi:hypothetical protein